MKARDWRLRLTRKNYILLHNPKIMRRTANVSVTDRRDLDNNLSHFFQRKRKGSDRVDDFVLQWAKIAWCAWQ